MGLPLLCFGDILSILNVSGNVLSSIICVVKCVISGAIVLIVFFIIFIEMLSCPVECEFGALIIMFRMSSNVGSGISNVFSLRGYINFNTSIGFTGIFGIFSLSFLIEFI